MDVLYIGWLGKDHNTCVLFNSFLYSKGMNGTLSCYEREYLWSTDD